MPGIDYRHGADPVVESSHRRSPGHAHGRWGPSPAAFGKTAFGVGLSDYGSITSLHYGATNGAPDAAGAIAKAQPKTAEDKANDIKGQADLIAQQQRLITCRVSPQTCK